MTSVKSLKTLFGPWMEIERAEAYDSDERCHLAEGFKFVRNLQAMAAIFLDSPRFIECCMLSSKVFIDDVFPGAFGDQLSLQDARGAGFPRD